MPRMYRFMEPADSDPLGAVGGGGRPGSLMIHYFFSRRRRHRSWSGDWSSDVCSSDLSPAPRGNVHPIPTDANYPEGAGNLYAEELQTFYGADNVDPARPLFDLVLMGLGPDGHVASLYPQSRALDEKERWVLGVAKAGWEPFVPRVTLTFPTLASCQEMLFLVDGARKRDILRRVFAGGDLPGSRVYSNGDLVWMLDRAAAPETAS